MSDQVVPASIVARIRKLLALAGNNSNENEASAAASKAQEIMAEYNLEIAALGDGAETTESVRGRVATDLSVSKPWQEHLMATIAQNNFCSHWIEGGMSRRFDGTGSLKMRRRHNLIGRHVNVEVTISTYSYLVQAMLRLCPYEDSRSRSFSSWFTGCADRLVDRLGIQRQESEAASRTRRQDPGRGDGSSLVLSDVYSSEEELNNDLRYGYTPGTTGARRAAQEARMAEWEKKWGKEWREERSQIIVPSTKAEKPETDAQREKREARERRWYEGYQRRQQREAAKTDQYAYSQGSAAGRDIGLDTQISSGGAKKVLS